MLNCPTYTTNHNFDDVLLEAIDVTLNALGETVKTAIYFHLKDMFNIKKSDIPQRIPDFSDALEHIFGLGARYLEILFIKSIYSKIEFTGELSNYSLTTDEATFEEYVHSARQSFQSTRKNDKIIMQVSFQNLSIHPIMSSK